MDDITALFRTATDDAPPTVIDLDALIGRERRRRSRRLVAGAGGIAVALVVAAATGVVLLTGRPAPIAAVPATVPAPSVAPSKPCVHPTMPSFVPTRQADPVRPPSDDHVATARRLQTALVPLLPAGARSTAACGRMEVFWDTTELDYRAGTGLRGGRVSLVVIIRARDRGSPPDCLAVPHGCTRTTAADGSLVLSDLSDLDAGGRAQRSVTVDRPDDTRILLVSIGHPSELPSVATLAAIGRAPALTLYPAAGTG